MKKLLFFLMAMLFMSTALAQTNLPYHGLQVLDEVGVRVTDITSVSIFAPNTTSNATIFNDRAGNNAITLPMTESSTNTTLVDGNFFWYGPDGYDFTMTDGTNIRDNSGHRTRTASEGTIIFPSYMTNLTTSQYIDGESITFGTGADAVLSWNNSESAQTWIPASDGVAFDIGSTTEAKQFDFNVFVGGVGGGGLAINEGNATLAWTGGNVGISGGTISFNADSNFATNINTGSSTGAVNIGSSTAGNITLDSTAALSLNADDSVDISTSGANADIDIDSEAGSVIIDSGETSVDAVLITATASGGGVIISSTGSGDISLDAGDDILLAADNSTGDVISLINTQGTAEAATILRSVAGGIDIDAATGKNIAVTGGQFIVTSNEDVASAINLVTNTGTSETIVITNTLGSGAGAITLDAKAGAVDINATGANDGDMTIDVGDDMTITVGGDLVFAVTGDTTLPNDMLRKVTVAIADTEMDILENTQKELVAAVPGATIEFVSAIFALDWGTTAWTEPTAPDDLVIRYENGTGAIVSQLLDAAGFATGTEDTVLFLDSTVANAAGAAVASVGVTEANSTNKALVLDNTGSDWTNSGDSQVVVIVYYRLHTTAELGL